MRRVNLNYQIEAPFFSLIQSKIFLKGLHSLLVG